ncbi:hypothetical protein V6N12_057447 [Hibiscus sabdariffa]|uniref:Uncharacterized protein n=1 Tax=Hibiscus sabdariffa TaxID=183260 RepID=A0ABR2C5I6_9ROSI
MSLPGIQRRLEILQSSMMANSFLSWDVDLDKLVIETHGCSEAELEAIVMNAPYNALYREGKQYNLECENGRY